MLLACVGARGQTLAKKNWVGSGMTVAPWWQGAELYEIDPISFQDTDGNGFGDLKGISARLDYLQGLGVDGIVLSSMPLRRGGVGAQPFDEMYGREEDFDALVGEATRRKIRVLVDVPLSARETTEETVAAGRFWLSRGVAGLRLVREVGGAAPGGAQGAARVRELRRLVAGFAGQRVLLGDGGGPDGLQLVEDKRLAGRSTLRAGELRAELAAPADGALVSTEGSERAHAEAMAKGLAAVLLLGRGAPLIYFGQELGMAASGAPSPMQWGGTGFTTGTPWIAYGPNAGTANVEVETADKGSLLNWYRALGQLRHTSVAVREGAVEVLPVRETEVAAWVKRDRLGGAPAVVVVVNCSAREVVAGVGMGELHTLASTYGAADVVNGRGVVVPAYGVFVGEVRRGAGLEGRVR